MEKLRTQENNFFYLAFVILFYIIIFPTNISSKIANREKKLPYPKSQTIHGIKLDWASHKRMAERSDNWPITWANSNNQYTTWGDGGGFDGTNTENRVSLGVARIEGTAKDYSGKNVWGGDIKGSTDKITGKSYGIVAIKNTLYMWVSPGSDGDGFKEARLFTSTDSGETWEKVEWAFTRDEGLLNPTFLQFGRGHADARDLFVYVYVVIIKDSSKLEVQRPGEIALLRVPEHKILFRKAYEFFSGTDNTGNPVWTPEILKLVPVFQDVNGVGWNCAVSFNKGLKRYILTTEHNTSFKGNLGIFDAPEPWGPWTTVSYLESFGVPVIEGTTFYWNFSNKWLSDRGRRFVLLFSGIKENDSWNTVEGEFILTIKSKDKTEKVLK